MAIIGIIDGFASRDDLTKNVIMVGRGDRYVLLVDGMPFAFNGPHCSSASFDETLTALKLKMAERDSARWLSVRAIVGNNINARVVVTGVGVSLYRNHFPVEGPVDVLAPLD
ncbi:MAG: hypothetical protein Q7S87_16125 [Agitococcus sp.]|nr:hypothetical protein [Agitococcus sp.]